MDEVMVMSCGVVGWMPPPETGGMVNRYAVRFFTGETMQLTSFDERELQRLFDNDERNYAKAAILPSDCSTVLYAQVVYCTIRYIKVYTCTQLCHHYIVMNQTILPESTIWL